MAATPESKVKDKIKRLLQRHGAYYTMPVMTGMATNGTPDFAVCYAGLYLAIEAKADDKSHPTELQWARLAEVAKAGGSTMVVHAGNLSVLETWLQAVRIGEPVQVTAQRRPNSRACDNHAAVAIGSLRLAAPGVNLG